MRQPTISERTEVEYFLGLDVDRLKVDIGRTVGKRVGVQYAPETAIKEFEEWYESRKEDIKRKICSEWDYCNKRLDKNLKDRVTLVVNIADIIITILEALPVLSIASLVVKMGLDELCECNNDLQ